MRGLAIFCGISLIGDLMDYVNENYDFYSRRINVNLVTAVAALAKLSFNYFRAIDMVH